MGTLNEDLTAIKTIEDGLVGNKVAKFAYTDLAYCCNCVAGVETYDANKEQNIPVGTASVMKVNDTVLNKGYRAQASSVTRMLLNHFLGRLSYNLNKVNDNVANLLSTLISHRGTANGLATLDTNAKVPNSEIPLNIVRTVNGVGTADGAVTITYNDIGLSSTAGCPLGTASAGIMSTPARADHVHPMPACVAQAGYANSVYMQGTAYSAGFYFEGVDSMPSWVWAPVSETCTKLFNPSCFHVACADCAANATCAANAYRADSSTYADSVYMQGTASKAAFYYTGNSGQPSWVWGAVSETCTTLFNPSCFHVACADCASCASRASWSGITCQSVFYLIGTSSACCVYYDGGYIYNRSPHVILLFVPDSHPKVVPASSSVGVGTITLEEAGYIQIQATYE